MAPRAASREGLAAWIVVLLPLCAAACDEGDGQSPKAPASDAADEFGVPGCPSPDEPWVHYVSQDTGQCPPPEQLVCVLDTQFAFRNACGCGCMDKGDPQCPGIDDPDVRFFSRNPADCTGGLPACLSGETSFSNSCGCGCIQH
jgi:hypothetical protein